MSNEDRDAVYELASNELTRLHQKDALDEAEVEHAMRCSRLLLGRNIGFKLDVVKLPPYDDE